MNSFFKRRYFLIKFIYFVVIFCVIVWEYFIFKVYELSVKE